MYLKKVRWMGGSNEMYNYIIYDIGILGGVRYFEMMIFIVFY